MSFFKLNSGACIALVALAMLMTGSQAAQADTATLTCHMIGPPGNIEDGGSTSIELNEAQSSVVVHFAAYAIPSIGVKGPPAYSIGPLKATFSASTITFSGTIEYPALGGGTAPIKYAINRLTGDFSTTQGFEWNCQAGKKQF